jgi:exopolysaccharide biosynthesis WecB/TagA/CpsF family protein
LVPIQNLKAREALLRNLSEIKGGFVVAFVNAHAINMCARDRSVLESFSGADLLLRDGVGAAIGCKAYGTDPGENMNGTDFILELLRTLPPKRVALYGTRDPWLSRAADTLSSMGHEVVDVQHGFHGRTTYVARAVARQPDVIVLGMGIPKQEILALHLRAEPNLRALVLNGGAIIDFIGGRFPRAPKFIRVARLEWLFRLMREPRRLLRRYTIDVIVFLVRIVACGVALRGSRRHARPRGDLAERNLRADPRLPLLRTPPHP